jgi:hypothetical protein
MTQLIAICKISRKLPGSVSNETIGYDSDGEPVMRVISESITPGHLFEEQNEDIVRDLLKDGAAREPTETEILLNPTHEHMTS